MIRKTIILLIVFSAIFIFSNCKKKEISGKVFFIEPANSAELSSPVTVKMGV